MQLSSFLNRLCFFSIISFEDYKKRSVRANFYNERASVIVDSVSIIVIKSFINEQR